MLIKHPNIYMEKNLLYYKYGLIVCIYSEYYLTILFFQTELI